MRQLHIGGQVRTEGWEVLDALAGPAVDHVGDAKDLSRFPDATFSKVYASHVLEHFDYKDELLAVVKEWYRVLTPDGLLYISVPDMDTLCQIFCEREQLKLEQRFMIMRMLFGGHCTPYDYHKTGLNQEFLVLFLSEAGFQHIERVPEFNIFQDTSSLKFGEVLISVNLIAYKKKSPKPPDLTSAPCPCGSGKPFKECHGAK